MTLTDSDINLLLAAWLWPFCRIAALLTAAPLFSNRAVPARVRLGLALALTVVVAPLITTLPDTVPLSAGGWLVTANQVVIGLALGFALRLLFLALELAGQQVATLMGLGFAALVDPQSGIEVPVVSHFYILLTTLVFLGLDGHLVVIQILVESFEQLPVGSAGIGGAGFLALTQQVGWLLAAAVVMALPAVSALLIVNLGYGVMSRAAPQLNIFAVGFPITLLLGFAVMWLTLPGIVGLLSEAIGRSLQFARDLTAGAV